MYKYVLILSFSLISVYSFSQIKAKKEFQKCELIFKDSSSFIGFCKIGKADKIEFTIERDSTPDLWDAKDVKSVRFFGSSRDLELEYFYVRKGMSRLLEIREYGEILLYTRTKKIPYLFRNHEIDSRLFDKKSQNYFVTYYLKKASSDTLLPIRPSWNYKKWKKIMLDFFKDCPLIVEDLKADAYDKESIRKLVQDYNVYCVD
ncbi:hypothetical protein [Kordia zhangzhouensis]|uniref:hypothetical protein n=1 Tax=Kordia zhangzhouensis TaxID=1620405 RepID=UPI000628FB17|nr:hypothetical protein [Kordia zhangzhouensis]